MAKNCINPQCQKELPNSALFCFFCGTQQVEEEKLSEEERLRKELSEMQQTNQLLKKALADVQPSTENTQATGNRQKQPEKQPVEPIEMPSFSSGGDETEYNQSNTKRWLAPVLIVLVVLIGFLGFYLFNEKQQQTERIARIEEERRQQEERITRMEEEKRQQAERDRVEEQRRQQQAHSNIERTTPNANTVTETAAKPDSYAHISGTNVMLRASYSTTSKSLATLKQSETVKILDSYYPSNTNEAICKSAIKLYSSNGSHVFTLERGKAVQVASTNGSQYEVSFIHPQYGKMTATVYQSDLESISGDKWYKVQRNSGETGWVFSKFVTLH